MGVFRLALAFCVVLSHGLHIPIPAAAADIAVQTFYIVSGFYMALVLTEKYHDYSTYFTNRLLRLYPAYLAIALVTLAHSLFRWMLDRSAADPGLLAYESHFRPLDLPAKLYLIGTNALLWGQDLALFLKISNDGTALAFTTNFALSSPRVEKFLLVPQAWSLAIELLFYVLAPWLVRCSTLALAGVVAATIAARLGLASIGLSFDPWTYRFFPVEIGSFVLGMLAYRSMRVRTASQTTRRIATSGLIAAALLLSVFPDSWLTRIAFYGYCVWALPLAFQLTRHNSFDRYLGELSYPVYLSHLLVISVALYSGLTGTALGLLIIAMTAAAAVAVHEVIQKPVDRYRSARISGNQDRARKLA